MCSWLTTDCGELLFEDQAGNRPALFSLDTVSGEVTDLDTRYAGDAASVAGQNVLKTHGR